MFSKRACDGEDDAIVKKPKSEKEEQDFHSFSCETQTWVNAAVLDSRADDEDSDGNPCAEKPCDDLFCCWKRWYNTPRRNEPHLLRRHAFVNMLDKSRDRMLDDGETLADEIAHCIWSARSALKCDGPVSSVPFYKRCCTNDCPDLWQMFVQHFDALKSEESLAMFLCLDTGSLLFSTASQSNAEFWDTARFRLIYSTYDVSVAFYLQFKNRGICKHREDSDDDEDDSLLGCIKCNCATVDDVDGHRRFLQVCTKLSDIKNTVVLYCGKPALTFIEAQFRREIESKTALVGYSKKYNEFVNFTRDTFRSDEFVLVYDNLQ